MTEPEGLKHAPEAVIEVIAKHDHSDDVEERDGPNLKAIHNVVVHIVRVERAAWMNRAKSEMKKMVDEEYQDDRTAPHHGARRVTRSDVCFPNVGDGARFLLKEPQLERRPDVKNDGDEKRNASSPQRIGVCLEKCRIVIDFLGGLIDLEIAEQVTNNEAEENQTSDGHDGFLTDGGLPETKRAGRKRDSRSAHGMNRSLLLLRIMPNEKSDLS